jgi:hypothetical protein
MKIKSDMDENEMKRFLSRIHDLVELEMIEYTGDQIRIGHTNKFYKSLTLTEHGILYILMNIDIFFINEPLVHILKNYPDTIFFRKFLYPYLTRKTLHVLHDLYSKEILYYLNNICTQVLHSMFWHYNLITEKHNATIDSKYTQRHLFYWPKTNGGLLRNQNNSHKILKIYLYKEFSWEWVKDATVNFDYANNRIDLKNGPSSAIITISIANKTVTLRSNRQTYYNRFKILDDRQDSVSVVGRFKSVNDFLNSMFLPIFQKELLVFLFEIQYNNGLDSGGKLQRVKSSLNKDPNFNRIINEMIDRIRIKDQLT